MERVENISVELRPIRGYVGRKMTVLTAPVIAFPTHSFPGNAHKAAPSAIAAAAQDRITTGG